MADRQADSDTTVKRADRAVLWITMAATFAALALSFRNQIDFATQHGGYPVWAAWAFPLMIDSFVIVGEIRLYRATYKRERSRRIKAWAWTLTLGGLTVSMAAGAAHAGLPAWFPAEQLAAAVAPLAAAASLGTALGIVKLNARPSDTGQTGQTRRDVSQEQDSRSRARQPGNVTYDALVELVRADKDAGLPVGRQSVMTRHGVTEHQARVAVKAASNGSG